MANIPIKEITQNAERICNEHGAYLYDILYTKEGKNRILRIFADTTDGIGIDLCEKISRDISAYLDNADLIDTAYSLEVSSPGAERKLRTLPHFNAVMGEKIKLSFYAPLPNGEKVIVGILKGCTEKEITLLYNNKEMTFERDKISDASLYFDVNEFLKSH